MIRSMTGYGEAVREEAGARYRVEIRTVNHRFFNPNVKVPGALQRFERPIVEWLKPFFRRGHVALSLFVEPGGEQGPGLVVDVERARAYAEALRELRAALDLAGDVSLADVLRFGDVVQPSRGPDAGDVDEALLRALVEEAAAAAVALREVEGERLRADFEARLDALAEELGRIEARAPERLVAERDRLREAVRALAEQDDVDEERLAREIAYLAEKWDIAEELVRFRSHIELFRETLAGDGEESVGKRLSFVVQEMHREANTIGSKANDATISQAAMALKEEIERLREQVENVE